MLVSVFQGQTHLGTAKLEHLDPPMGVAFGPFSPSGGYDRDKHANTIEGEYVADRGQSLSISDEPYGTLKMASTAIEDWTKSQLGLHLTVWFQDSAGFAALFAWHPDFKSYYSQGL